MDLSISACDKSVCQEWIQPSVRQVCGRWATTGSLIYSKCAHRKQKALGARSSKWIVEQNIYQTSALFPWQDGFYLIKSSNYESARNVEENIWLCSTKCLITVSKSMNILISLKPSPFCSKLAYYAIQILLYVWSPIKASITSELILLPCSSFQEVMDWITLNNTNWSCGQM